MFTIKHAGDKVLKIILFFSFLTLSGLSFADDNEKNHSLLTADDYLQLTSILDDTKEYSLPEAEDKKMSSNNQISPRSKLGSEALTGTWYLTYLYQKPHTDIIVINGTSSSESTGEFAVGAYYADITAKGVSIACIDDTQSVYFCFAKTADNQYKSFYFTFAKNIITSGFFGFGSTAEAAEKVALNKRYPIAGFRDPESAGPKYNDGTGELILPSVEYQGNYYRVKLQDQGGFIFGIKEVGAVQ